MLPEQLTLLGEGAGRVTAQELAELLQIDELRLRSLVKRGVLPASSGGTYDSIAAVHAFLKHMHDEYVPKYRSQRELSQLLGFNESRFQQLRARGDFPDPILGRGFDVVASLLQYIRSLKGRASEQNIDQRRLELRYQREKRALEREEMNLVSREEVLQALSETDRIIIDRLEAIPGRLAPKLVGESETRIRQLLLDAIRDARNNAGTAIARLAQGA